MDRAIVEDRENAEAGRLSDRVERLKSSPIRDILAAAGQPGMVSLAGGLPADEALPHGPLGAPPAWVWQYGPSEGRPELRAAVTDDLERRGLRVPAERVLILSGSQQGIDLVAKLFIDPGAPVAVEDPTYLAALQAFRFHGARFVPLGGPARFAYVNPTFQNPTGRCWSAEERAAFATRCDAAALPLVEDDPYRDLALDGPAPAPIAAGLRRAPWVYQGTFSKSFAPGIRVGYLAASDDLFPLLVRLKQAADLHTSGIGQWLALRWLQDPSRHTGLAAAVALYRRRRDAFHTALRASFAGLATWERPAGGLFFWLRLTERRDTRPLLARALEAGVAFMPGEPFFANPADGLGTLRLNFSNAAEADAARAIATLAGIVRRAAG